MSAQLQSPSSSSEPQVPLILCCPGCLEHPQPHGWRHRPGDHRPAAAGRPIDRLEHPRMAAFPCDGRHLPGLGLSHPQIRPDYPWRHLCRPGPGHVHPGRPVERSHGPDPARPVSDQLRRRLGLDQPALAGHLRSLGLVAIDPRRRHRPDRCGPDGRRPGSDGTEFDQHASGP